MGVLCARASGNWLDASTWAQIDSASYDGVETTNTTVTTTLNRCTAFVPPANEVDAVAVKFVSNSGLGVGRIAVDLFNETTATVIGTVSINTTDVPLVNVVLNNVGWTIFKLPTPHTPNGTDSYSVGLYFVGSGVSGVNAYANLSANWSHFLRRTSTAAPVGSSSPDVNDDLIICGEWVPSASPDVTTLTSFSVVMNQTSPIDYGSNLTPTSTQAPALAIGNGGTLSWPMAGSPDLSYVLRLSGYLIVYAGGTLNIGTAGSPIPRSATAILEFDCIADGDYGLRLQNLSTCNIYGQSRTAGKDIYYCKLNTDEAVNSTSLGVDTDTGWLDNDQIVVASTTRTATNSEVGALNGDAGASTLTVDGFAGAGGGLAVAHSGTSPTQAEVINLTRNVKIRSVTAASYTFVSVQAAATATWRWVELLSLGGDTTGKRGVEVNVSTGTFDAQYCSIHDCESNGFYLNNTGGDNFTLVNNVFWNLNSDAGATANAAIVIPAVSGTNWTVTGNICIGMKGATAFGFSVGKMNGTFSNNTAAGGTNTGFLFTTGFSGAAGTNSGNVAHSNGGNGFHVSSVIDDATWNSITAWRNGSFGIAIAAAATALTIDGATLFGNATTNINLAIACQATFKNIVANGDTTFVVTNGINLTAATAYNLRLIDCDFSTVSGIKTAHTNDINVGTSLFAKIVAVNCKFGALNEVATSSNLLSGSYIAMQNHDQVANTHIAYKSTGSIETDAVIFRTATPSLRLYPASTTEKLDTAVQTGMLLAVIGGKTKTPSVYVRKSAVADGGDDYDGAQPRLILKKNTAIGIVADTVIDTMTVANGTWEQLTGTTAAATADGVMEFVVDCDRSSLFGFVNVDDWSA